MELERAFQYLEGRIVMEFYESRSAVPRLLGLMAKGRQNCLCPNNLKAFKQPQIPSSQVSNGTQDYEHSNHTQKG